MLTSNGCISLEQRIHPHRGFSQQFGDFFRITGFEDTVDETEKVEGEYVVDHPIATLFAQ